MFLLPRTPATLNKEYHNFDAATEETYLKTQAKTTIEDEIELLIRSSIPFVSEDPPRPSNRRGRAPDSLIFGEPEEKTNDASHSPSQAEPVDLATILSMLNAELHEEEDEELDFVPLDNYNSEESIPSSFRIPDALRASGTPTVPESGVPFSQPTPQTVSARVPPSSNCLFPTQSSPAIVVPDAAPKLLDDAEMEHTSPPPSSSFAQSASEDMPFVPKSSDCPFPDQSSPAIVVPDTSAKLLDDAEMEHTNQPPKNSFTQSASEAIPFVQSSPRQAPVAPPPSSSFESPPQPPSSQPSGPGLSLGELQRQLTDAVIQAVISSSEFARGSMDIQGAHQMIQEIAFTTLGQYPRFCEIQILLSVQVSDIEALARQVVTQFLATVKSMWLQNQQQVCQPAIAPANTAKTLSTASHEDNSPASGASPEGCPEVAVEQEQEWQQRFLSDFQFMKLKDGLPSIPEVSEVPAFVLQFRETYPFLEDEVIWKIVMWFHPELHGQKSVGDTFIPREEAVRAALAEVRHWRFPSSDAAWAISADDFFSSSQGDVLAKNILLVKQEAGASSVPSTPSPPPTPGQEILPLGDMFQEHQDIHTEGHEDLCDNWDNWCFDPEQKWSKIYVPSYNPETEQYSAGQAVPFDQSYLNYGYDYHYDYSCVQYEQPQAQYEERHTSYEHSHPQYKQPHTQFDRTPVRQKARQPYAPSNPSRVQRDKQKDRRSPGLASSLRRLLRTYVQKDPPKPTPEPRRSQRPAGLSQRPIRLTPQNSCDSWDYRYGAPNTVVPEPIYGLDQAPPQNPHQLQDKPDCHLDPEPAFDLNREPAEDCRYSQGYPHCHPYVDLSHSDTSSSDSETGRDTDQESDNGPPLPGQPSSVCVHGYFPWSALSF